MNWIRSLAGCPISVHFDSLQGLVGAVAPVQIEAASIYLLAGIEGLAIERLDEEDPKRLESACQLFIRATGLAIMFAR